MNTCEVKLTIGRATTTGAQNRGQTVSVGLLEAGRLIRQGACEQPDAATMKAIAQAEAAAEVETTAAPKGKGRKAKGSADTTAPAGSTSAAE